MTVSAPDLSRCSDLGDDHWLKFIGWSPDRDLNPQYADVPDVDRYCAAIYHRRSDGTWCTAAVTFDTPEVAAVDAASRAACEAMEIPYHGAHHWTVEAWEPLTLSPSVLCCAPLDGGTCGDHGFIRSGKWVRA